MVQYFAQCGYRVCGREKVVDADRAIANSKETQRWQREHQPQQRGRNGRHPRRRGDLARLAAANRRGDVLVLGVAAGLVLRVQSPAVHDDVEHSLGPGDQRQFADDVLVVGQEITDRAHGAGGIVSGDAVLDVDHVHVRGA